MPGNLGRLLFTFAIIGAFIYITAPLLLPVLMGGVFAVLFFPWLERLEQRKLSTTGATALLTVGITAVILVPAAILLFLGVKALFEQVRIIQETPRNVGVGLHEQLMNNPGVRNVLEKITTWFPVELDQVAHAAGELARTVGLKLADLLGGLITQLPGLVTGLLIMVISIFFFLVDGRKLAAFVRANSVFTREDTERLIHSFAGMCRSVMLATVASGFAQSLLFGFACLVTGTAPVALISFLVFLASFIPLVGSAPVTFGVAIQQLLLGNRTVGIVLFVMAILVGLVDNVIRPVVLRGAGNLHPLLAFVAAFGGLQTLGFAGVFIGPILAALCVVTIQNLTRPNRVV